ncbi:MAG: spermidine synthase, partial [Candidatus Binatia bacterium]
MALLSAVVLLVQITATRLLSATVAYHAAFAVLALVMLALAGSATAVYRDRSNRKPSDAPHDLGPAAGMAIAAGPVVAATGLLYIFVGALPWPSALYQAAHFLAAGIGFYACFHACGYAVAWLLAAWPKDVGRVYFADLLGAALGCLLAVPALSTFSPVQLLCLCGVGASFAGFLLAADGRVRVRALSVAAVVGVLAVTALLEPSWVRLRSAKMQDQSKVLFEKWNQLARVTVSPEVPGTLQAIELLSQSQTPEEARAQVLRWTAGWGMSQEWTGSAPESMWIELDTDAGTQILRGGGVRPLEDFDALKWDVTAAAHWLRPGGLGRTFVIGGGGGRDFLTALAFGAKRVDVVELNPLVVAAVEEVFGDYSGRPYSRPGVHYRLGDARSELSRSPDRYDLIQMSMIDTWAASMTGALTLSENALYTREAFHAYLAHLTDPGIFTVSRWYGIETYAETARVLSLMGDALRSAGVAFPENHVAVVFNEATGRQSWVATCMMKRT